MGKLGKAKVDQIKRLYKEGFLKAEIAKKVKVSRSSVGKYLKDKSGKGDELDPAVVSGLLRETVKTLYEVLAVLNLMAYLEVEEVADMADTVALQLTRNIARAIPDYAKSLIKVSPYIKYLTGNILDLSMSDDELDERGRWQRKTWVTMMKKYYPEKLGQLL